MDLTRTIPAETNKDTTRKLAFSVENILDPNKFCSKKDKFNARHWIENYERGERGEHLDDDQSESQSGELNSKIPTFFVLFCILSSACEGRRQIVQESMSLGRPRNQ